MGVDSYSRTQYATALYINKYCVRKQVTEKKYSMIQYTYSKKEKLNDIYFKNTFIYGDTIFKKGNE